MDMTQAIEKGLTGLGFETQAGDGGALLTFLIEHVDSEAAQVFRKEVSDYRRRAYMAEHMRQKRAALSRQQAETQWTPETYMAAVVDGLKVHFPKARVSAGHEKALVDDGLRRAAAPADVAEAIIAHRAKVPA